jgi:hypothetical protein
VDVQTLDGSKLFECINEEPLDARCKNGDDIISRDI